MGCLRVRHQCDDPSAPVSRWDIVHGLDGFGSKWPKIPQWVTPCNQELCLLGGIWKALLSLVHDGKLLVDTGRTCELMLLKAGQENDDMSRKFQPFVGGYSGDGGASKVASRDDYCRG